MVKPLQFLILVFLSLLLITSCSAVGSKAGTPVTDEELDAAIEEAHSTLDTLLAAMLAPQASHDFLGLKVRFATKDGGYDDNWVEPVDYYDGKFTIRMMDGLTYDKNLHTDRTLDIPLKKVVDWMIVEKDGTLIGGYTIKLAYEHMSPAEKKEFLRVTGYKLR